MSTREALTQPTGHNAAKRRWSFVAVGALAFAFAYPMQVNGVTQNSHYALVRALAQGTPTVDKTRYEIGDLGTGDVILFRGHWYSNKASGLAFVSLPAFYVVEAVGMRTTGDPTRVIWALHLWSIVLPALGLIVLVRWAGNQVDPRYGTAAAVTLGAGTLVLPFSTPFYSHGLSAFLGFAAFTLLWYERTQEPRLELVAAAGVLAGLAVTAEYPLVIVGATLGIYALTRPGPVRRGFAYALGALVGVLPLLLYNLWAFGSVTHISAADERVDHVGFFRVPPATKSAPPVRPPVLGLGARDTHPGSRVRRPRGGSHGSARPARGGACRHGDRRALAGLRLQSPRVQRVRRLRSAALPDHDPPVPRSPARSRVPLLSVDNRQPRCHLDLPDGRRDSHKPTRGLRRRLSGSPAQARRVADGGERRRRHGLVHDSSPLRSGATCSRLRGARFESAVRPAGRDPRRGCLRCWAGCSSPSRPRTQWGAHRVRTT